jgi:hypothetical protein
MGSSGFGRRKWAVHLFGRVRHAEGEMERGGEGEEGEGEGEDVS